MMPVVTGEANAINYLGMVGIPFSYGSSGKGLYWFTIFNHNPNGDVIIGCLKGRKKVRSWYSIPAAGTQRSGYQQLYLGEFYRLCYRL